MNKRLLNLLACDGYKLGHREQYPDNTTLVFSNFTPRGDKWSATKDGLVYVFGLEYHLTKLVEDWTKYFFHAPTEEFQKLLADYKLFVASYLGQNCETVTTQHLEDLRRYGRLPLDVRIVERGTHNIKKPILTIHNTNPKFAWLVNFLESRLSADIWQTITSATVARKIRDILLLYGQMTDETNVMKWIDYASHDFCLRGMSSIESAINSGLGHLAHFSGSDNIPATIEFNRFYNPTPYKSNNPKSPIMSVIATEHSVMSAGGKDNECATYERLLDLYPNQILSIVSDTWNLWEVIDKYLYTLKNKIMMRKHPLVIRPDSGNPIDIICGEYEKADLSFMMMGKVDTYKKKSKGVIERLWDVFGGTINEQGYKVLHPSIRVIYGDSITLDNLEPICKKLKEIGFAVTNLIFGVGSYTYQYNTRDTYGFAMKTTYVEINGIGREVSKDPITDSGLKKSAVGLLAMNNGQLIENATWEQVNSNKNNLTLFIKDGIVIKNK